MRHESNDIITSEDSVVCCELPILGNWEFPKNQINCGRWNLLDEMVRNFSQIGPLEPLLLAVLHTDDVLNTSFCTFHFMNLNVLGRKCKTILPFEDCRTMRNRN